MGFDLDRFVHRFLGAAALPQPIGDGWAVVRVCDDRARRAIDVVLASSTGPSLTVFVEPLALAAAGCATTAALALSYYSEPGLAELDAALALEALAARLRTAEAWLGPGELGLGPWAEADVPGGAHRTLEVGINRECNEACLFCNTPASSESLAPSRDAVRERIAAGRGAGFDALTLTGREPTLDPLLADHLRFARALGYEHIRVQSNGTSWAERSRLAEHVAAGMTSAEISLHTLAPDTFSELVGSPALLALTLRAIGNLAAWPELELCIVVVLTTRNLGELPTLVEHLCRQAGHVRAVSLSPMAPVGRALARLELLPRLGALGPPLAAAFAAAERHGLRIGLPARCGAPPCAMPPGGERYNVLCAPGAAAPLDPGKSKPASCVRCRHDGSCPGVWSVYRSLHGDAELVPCR